MRKKSIRLVSATLAACMMASTLPVGAFALEVGTGDAVAAVSEQEAVTVLSHEGGTIGAGHYIMEGGEYTGNFTIDATGDVTIDITGNVTVTSTDLYERKTFLKVVNATTVTINGRENGKDHTVVQNIMVDMWADFFCSNECRTATVVFNGGNYKTIMNAYNSRYMFENIGTMELNDVTADLDWSNFNDRGFGMVHNLGSMTINGGTYVRADGGFLFWNGGEMTVNGGIFQGSGCFSCGDSAFQDGEKTEGKIIINDCEATGTNYALSTSGNTEINGGKFTSSGKEVFEFCAPNNMDDRSFVVNGGTLIGTGTDTIGMNMYYFKWGGEGSKTLTVNRATIQGCKTGIYVKNNLTEGEWTKVNLGDINIEDADTDVYLEVNQDLNINKKLAQKLNIEVENPGEGRAITTVTQGDTYQKDLKLVSLNEGWVIDWDKDNGNRYLTKRDDGKNYVNPINATMTADGEEKRPYSQFAQGDKVTLTADIPEGKKFVVWKVEKIAAEGVEDVSEKVNIVCEDPENPETATLTMPGYDIFVTAEYEDVIIDPGTGDGDHGGSIAAGVVIGGITAVGAYEVGTGLYRITQMDDVAMPANRLALAKLLWERAGKPEPENLTDETLYSDMDAEDTDAQKAARWAVEQELLNDDDSVEGERKFHPAFPVSKLRVCLTWEKAKQKGLFDQNTEA